MSEQTKHLNNETRGLLLSTLRLFLFSTWMESLFAPVLTHYTQDDEDHGQREGNAGVQTFVCSRVKGELG